MQTFIDSIMYFFGIGDNPIIWKPKDDLQAMQIDWENIGKDFQKALLNYGR